MKKKRASERRGHSFGMLAYVDENGVLHTTWDVKRRKSTLRFDQKFPYQRRSEIEEEEEPMSNRVE